MNTPPDNASTTLVYSNLRPIAWMDIITMALGSVMLVSGLLSANTASVVFGLVALGYVFLFTHSRYDIFEHQLVIRYRLLRRRIVPLELVEVVERIDVALVGPSVLVALRSGSRLFMRPRDPDTFVEQVKKVLERTYPGQREQGGEERSS